MDIYGIKNTVTDRILVGQTTRNSTIRWKEHKKLLRVNKHENPHLQHAWNKYGETIFTLCILQEGIQTQEELDRLEEEYRLKFYPNVYNLRTGGNGGCKFDKSTRKRMSLAHKGQIITEETRRKMSIGIRKARSEMDCSWDTKRRNAQARQSRPDGYPKIVSPEGKIFSIVNLNAFRIEHKLNGWCLRNVLDGKAKHHKGWSLSGQVETNKGMNISVARRPNGYPVLVSPTGEQFSGIQNLAQFCKEHKLPRSAMCKVVNGQKRYYKGWRIK